jgi:phenylalanyl-tRNA synthetase beta chain
MKISYNWLKNYCDVNLPAAELSKILTDCGLEVEGIEKFQSVRGGLEGIVIGEVKAKKQHPNADRLSVTTVNVGQGQDLQIVCGAANVQAGQKVLVALVGSTLYPTDGASFKINKTKIRGEVSEGMICAEDEIGIGHSHEGIMVLEDTARIGMPASEYFKIENDSIFEIGLTPNRSDAASHIGVARDLYAALVHAPIPRKAALRIPGEESLKADNNAATIEVSVEDPAACPRYAGVVITGLNVGPSPSWLQNRLLSIGVRPINNIVDITNYVLHDCGQPLHAFDLDKIQGKKVVVKKLPSGTPFRTLDNEERKLQAEDLMICHAGGGMCIAGVYGGLESGVTEKTEGIFLESAYFDPAHIRRTSKHHNLKTDAAFRFERGVDPNNVLYALKKAALMIREIAGGKISSEPVDIYPEPIQPFKVDLNYDTLFRLAGNRLDKKAVAGILKDLGIKISKEDEKGLALEIPTFKVDVRREADVIEEVLRIYGYNNIVLPPRLNSTLTFENKPEPDRLQELISDYLSAQGFNEIMNLSFTSPEYPAPESPVEVLNPLSRELSVLRQTLLFGGLETIEYNKNRKQNDLRLFEFGKTYTKAENQYKEVKRLSLFLTGRKYREQWNSAAEKVDFFYLKAFVENVFKRLGVSGLSGESSSSEGLSESFRYVCRKDALAELGKVKPSLLKHFDIGQDVYYAEINWDLLLRQTKPDGIVYREIPKFPEVRRDLSMVLDKNVQFRDIERLSFESERNYLRNVNLFDVYEGDKIGAGKKSYALSFILVNEEDTLTDKQIDKAMERIMQNLEKSLGAVIRK